MVDTKASDQGLAVTVPRQPNTVPAHCWRADTIDAEWWYKWTQSCQHVACHIAQNWC